MTGRATAGRLTSRTGGLALVGLSVGALVVLLVAPAFACTPAGGGKISFYPTRVAAGDTVRVEGYELKPGAGFKIFVFTEGPPVAEGVADERGTFLAEIKAPAPPVDSAGRALPYQMSASTQKTDGTFALNPQTMEPAASVGQPGTTTTSALGQPTTTPTTVRGPLASAQPLAQLAAGPDGDGASFLAPADRPLAAPSGPGVPADPIAASGPGGVGTPVAGAAEADDRPGPGPDLPVVAGPIPNADIWAGLQAERAPTLVDPPSTSSGGLPAGALVLGGGFSLFGLTALALLVGRRRLAVAMRVP